MNQPSLEELVKQAEELAEDARRCRDEMSAAEAGDLKEQLDDRLASIQERLARNVEAEDASARAGPNKALSLRQYIGLLLK